jgi:hypothetical protein
MEKHGLMNVRHFISLFYGGKASEKGVTKMQEKVLIQYP